jgi:hypothetical protein
VKPAPAVTEAAPSPAEVTNDLPLPPPPKPAFRQVATAEAAHADEPLANAADDPPSAGLEEGLGGPFQPLFVKLPASRAAPTQVLVHYPASAVGGPATARHLARLLRAQDLTVEARAVEFQIQSSSIHYFAAADRARAEALRASLEGRIPGGAALPVLDFTHTEPKPRAGHLEIWLSL